MFFGDHEAPHLHIENQAQLATFDFSGKLLAVELRSARARLLVRKWRRLREHELRANREELKALQPRRQIAPLA
jgi:hypothetical protein